MRRLLIALIGLATPAVDREWVVGDTIEQFNHIEAHHGRTAARRWLLGEAWRVLRQAPGHRLTARRPTAATHNTGDTLMSSIWQDLRYALRLLGRAPGFAATAIVTLALGIGANTAMFAVVNAVLLKPLPFKDTDRLMFAHLLSPNRESPRLSSEMEWSYPKYRTFLELQQVFEDAALFYSRDLNLAGDDAPERVRGEVVTDRYHTLLAVAPVLGRTFTFDEANREGMTPAVMIGYGLWTRRFGSDPAIVGRTIQIDSASYTVVGVLPRGFQGLSGNTEIWVPLATVDAWALNEAQGHSYYLVAQRKPGVSEQAAVTAVRALGPQIDAVHREGPGNAWGATAAALNGSRVDADVRRASIVLLGAVGLVLLIACVNLTNVVGARAIARRREVAVRVALGAGRGRIVRQFVAEGVVLAALGAIAGLALAWGVLQTATSLLPESDVFFRTAMAPGAPRTTGAAGLTRIGAAMIGFDARTLAFTLGIAAITAVMVSLMPALHAASLRPAEALKGGGRTGTERGFRVLGLRGVLVTGQISLALILLTGAGLMIKSAERLYGTTIGVTPDHVLTARLDLPAPRYTRQNGGGAILTQLTDRLRVTPGIESVGLANCVPVGGSCNGTPMWSPNEPRQQGKGNVVGIHWASPDFFPTVGIHVIQGRNFTDQDRPGRPKVALVNEAAAKAFWPNDTPIGKIIAVGQGGFSDGAEIVGIVANVRYRGIESDASPDVYIPIAQSFQSRMRIYVRSRLGVRDLVPLITREVRALDPNLPLSEIKTMNERVDDAMWRTRVGAWLLSAFAGLALLLTAIGIFGVMAQTVMQRTAEIGIRMALGAQRRDVLAMVLRRAALITGVGTLIGVACALVLTRVIETMLYGVHANDPATLSAVAALLGVVALVACYLPARRATRIDAVVALRSE